jgi:hypothetical protein
LLHQHHIDLSVTQLLNELNQMDTFSISNGRDHHV